MRKIPLLLLILAAMVFVGVAPATTPTTAPEGGGASTQAAGGIGISVTGRVLDKPGGEGVKGIKVNLVALADHAARSSVTDEQGRYAFDDVAYIGMAHLVQVGEHGPGVWTEDGRVFVPKPEAGAPPAITAPDLYATTPCTISGTVKDVQTGKGVADAPIRVSTVDRNFAEFKTDQNGAYLLHLVPREVQLDCDGTDDRYLPADGKTSRKLSVKAGDAVKDTDFTVRSAPRFTGQVLLPEGTPAAKLPVLAMVRWSVGTVEEGKRIAESRALREERIKAGTERPVTKAEVEGGPVRMSDTGGVGKEVRLQTDATGHFEGYLRRPDQGDSGKDEALDIIVLVRTADKTLGAFKVVQMTTIDPPPEPITVTLARTAAAQFEVLDSENHPLADATCAAHSWLFDYINLGDDIPEVAPELANLGKGQYRAAGLVPKWDYRLRASAEGYKCRNEMKVIAEPGETVTGGKLMLER